MSRLRSGEIGLLAAEATFSLGDGHPFAGAHPDQVGFGFCDHTEHVEQQPADRVARVIDTAAEAERDTFPREFVRDIARVRKGSGESVELRHDAGVAGTHCR
jgi:hypothetical protein